MKIPKEILNAWKLDMIHGEIGVIHQETGISRNTISKAISSGNTSAETFEALKKYFKRKKKKIADLTRKTLAA